MRKIALALAVLATAAFSQTASAADMPAKAAPKAAVPAVAAYNWAGFYIGIQGGYGWGDVSWDYVPTSATNEDHSSDGGLFGVTIGYNFYIAPQWVAGVEADWAWAQIDGGTSCPNPAFRCQTEIKELGTVRARIGYAANNALLYITGGGAWSRLEAETVNLAGLPVAPSGTPTNGETKTLFGWTLGAGLEWGFLPNWSFKFEYLHMNFGDENYNIDSGLVVNVEEDVNVARAGINYRF